MQTQALVRNKSNRSATCPFAPIIGMQPALATVTTETALKNNAALFRLMAELVGGMQFWQHLGSRAPGAEASASRLHKDLPILKPFTPHLEPRGTTCRFGGFPVLGKWNQMEPYTPQFFSAGVTIGGDNALV